MAQPQEEGVIMLQEQLVTKKEKDAMNEVFSKFMQLMIRAKLASALPKVFKIGKEEWKK